MTTQRKQLLAVHDDDLKSVLYGLGVSHDFEAGMLKCAFCRQPVSYDNLQAVFPDSGAVKFCCSKPECIRGLMSRMEQRRYG